MGCTLILDFRGELAGDNTFATTRLRDAAAFSIYNSIFATHSIDIGAEAANNARANPPPGDAAVEWYLTPHQDVRAAQPAGAEQSGAPVKLDTHTSNPTPKSLLFWGGPVSHDLVDKTCTNDKDCTEPAMPIAKCIDGRCHPWGGINIKPRAANANVLRMTFSIHRVKPTGTCRIDISNGRVDAADSTVLYFTYETKSNDDHFGGVRFVAVPLKRNANQDDGTFHNVIFHVMGHCVVEVELLTAERIESAMPGLFPEVADYDIPLPEGGGCQQELDQLGSEKQGCDSTEPNELATSVIGDLIPYGSWSFDWASTFNPFQKFILSTKSGVQKELHIHPQADQTGSLVFTLSTQAEKEFDLLKYDGIKIRYNLISNAMSEDALEKGTDAMSEDALENLTDAIDADIENDQEGNSPHRLGVVMTDRRGSYQVAKDVVHDQVRVQQDERKYEEMPSHKIVKVLFPLRSDTEDVKIAFHPSDKKLIIYSITFFSSGKFIDFSPIECPTPEHAGDIFDATPALMSSLEPLGAWRYESDASTSASGGFRDQVFQCYTTPMSTGLRSSLSFSGWRNIKGRLILNVELFGQNYNRLELGYRNTYVASGQESWQIIKSSKACQKNVAEKDSEGITSAFGGPGFATLALCKAKCLNDPSCSAIDYYSSSGWCNKLDKACTDPKMTGEGASSFKLHRAGQQAHYSYCQLSVVVHDTDGRTFAVLNQQTSDPASGEQILYVDLHSKSKEIHFVEEGDCVFYMDYIRLQKVGTEVIFARTTHKKRSSAVIQAASLPSGHPAGFGDRRRNFFRVSVEPPQCSHIVTLCKDKLDVASMVLQGKALWARADTCSLPTLTSPVKPECAHRNHADGSISMLECKELCKSILDDTVGIDMCTLLLYEQLGELGRASAAAFAKAFSDGTVQDQDHQTRTITAANFLSLVDAKYGTAVDNAKMLFAQFDRDNDGKLAETECTAAAAPKGCTKDLYKKLGKAGRAGKAGFVLAFTGWLATGWLAGPMDSLYQLAQEHMEHIPVGEPEKPLCMTLDLSEKTGAVAGTIPWDMNTVIDVVFEDKNDYKFKCDVTLTTEAFPITLDGVDAYDACLGLVHHTDIDDDVNRAIAGLEPMGSWSSGAGTMIFDCNRRQKDSFLLNVSAPAHALRLDIRSPSSQGLRGIRITAESTECQLHGELAHTTGGTNKRCEMVLVNDTTTDHMAYNITCDLHALNGLGQDSDIYEAFGLMYEGNVHCSIRVLHLELDYGFPVSKVELRDFIQDGALTTAKRYADFADYTNKGSPNANLRNNGLQYAGVETLSVLLANYDNVLNVHGTSSKTLVTFQDGDDYIVVSSAASTTATAKEHKSKGDREYSTSLPDGTLEYIQENVAFDLARGHHRIEISDVKSKKLKDVSFSAREIAYAAPGLISFFTTGDMGDGIFLWLNDLGTCGGALYVYSVLCCVRLFSPVSLHLLVVQPVLLVCMFGQEKETLMTILPVPSHLSPPSCLVDSRI